ncbi:phage terminase large subunit family protein [Sulfuricurvum sp.]|uniref:phage terminase large subunit family protein n=1 Tax=Sulfuricurvum sp. TaxID=2025608 RepID=UPI00356B02EA
MTGPEIISSEPEQFTSEELDFLTENFDVFAETIRTIKGQPFSLDKRPYLRAIYHEFVPYKPKTVVWKSSRKMEKTETICNLLLVSDLVLEYFVSLYTIARSKQVNVFSTERLDDAINSSVNGTIDAYLEKPSSISHKRFIVDNDRKLYNHLYMYSAWGDAVALLGLAGDFCVVDEVQDMKRKWFPKVKEIIRLSPHKWFLMAGTARDKGDEFDEMWEKSTKNEWEVQCKKCGRRQFLQKENVMKDPNKENEYYKGCIECKSVLNVLAGRWVETCEDHAKANFVGYHTHQMMHPQITATDIIRAREEYESERLWENEVWGMSYSGGTRPITVDQMLDCCDHKLNYVFSSEEPGNVFGMDCGKGHHIMVMDKNMKVLHMEFVDTMIYRTLKEEIDHIAKIFQRFNIQNAVVDWGYGQKEVRELQSIFFDIVKGCRYGITIVDKFYEYKEKDDQNNKIYRLNVNRSQAIEMCIEAIHNKKITFPYAPTSREVMEDAIPHFTNLLSDFEIKLGDKSYKAKDVYTRYGRSGPDHFLHTAVYCLIGLKFARKKEIKVWTVG